MACTVLLYLRLHMQSLSVFGMVYFFKLTAATVVKLQSLHVEYTIMEPTNFYPIYLVDVHYFRLRGCRDMGWNGDSRFMAGWKWGFHSQ